jgi:hypothetical protein
MRNLPFYIIEHGRKNMKISEWDKLFSMAELEFVDVIKTLEEKKEA